MTGRERETEVACGAESSKANIKKKLIKTSKNAILQYEDFSSVIRRATRLSKRSIFHYFHGNPLKYNYHDTLNTAICTCQKKNKIKK